MDREQKKEAANKKAVTNIDNLKSNMRREMRNVHERKRLTALAIVLMLETGERPGNDESAKLGHYGIITMPCKSVTIISNMVILNYVGKSGVNQRKIIVNQSIADHVQVLLKNKSGYLFHTEKVKIDRKQVNEALQPYGFTSKDIRTYLINAAIQKTGKKTEGCKTAIEKTAANVGGHKSTTLRKSYLLTATKKACKI
jgi:DNA topoisomerase IB